MMQHHLSLCCSFGTLTIVVFTKIDCCPDHALKTSKEELGNMMHLRKGSRRPLTIRNEQNISTCVGKLCTLTKVFDTLCVSGEGLSLLRKKYLHSQRDSNTRTRLIICSSFLSKTFSMYPMRVPSYQAYLTRETSTLFSHSFAIESQSNEIDSNV